MIVDIYKTTNNHKQIARTDIRTVHSIKNYHTYMYMYACIRSNNAKFDKDPKYNTLK